MHDLLPFQVIGCVTATMTKSNLEIGTLAVHPEHQGRGHGARLLEAAEKKGRNSSVQKIMLGVPSCRTDVIPFFTKMGYKVGKEALFQGILESV